MVEIYAAGICEIFVSRRFVISFSQEMSRVMSASGHAPFLPLPSRATTARSRRLRAPSRFNGRALAEDEGGGGGGGDSIRCVAFDFSPSRVPSRILIR